MDNYGSQYQQEGYDQGRSGLAASYYNETSQQQQYSTDGRPQEFHHQAPSSQHQSNSDGERGVMGAVGGGAVGMLTGQKLGHSKTSAVLGAVVGAISGHKVQDAVSDWKDDRKEEKEDEKHQHHEKHHHHHEKRRHDGHYAGNFTASSKDIHLDAHGEYNLHASCRRPDSSYEESIISLNTILENDKGSFQWATGNDSSGPLTVTVQQGDTLRGIAARMNCQFENIARHNNIQNPDLIYPGQVLQVPGNSGRSNGGGFGSSARAVRLSHGGQKLEGELLYNGDWVQSSIILDERIKNDNGILRVI